MRISAKTLCRGRAGTGTASTAPQVVVTVFDDDDVQVRQVSSLISDAVGGMLQTTVPPQGSVNIDLYPSGNTRLSYASLTNLATNEKAAKDLNAQNHVSWSFEAGKVGTVLNFALKATQGETIDTSNFINEVDYQCDIRITTAKEGD